MNPNEQYDIVGGRIVTRSLEVHIVDQCNLRCADCCSLSPVSEDRSVSPASMAADLALARTALAPARLKLVGGEPLLHPQLDECLAVARSSDIAPSISVTTNGLLLAQASPVFWALVDHLTISLYPKPALRPSQIEYIEATALANEVELNWKRQDSFVSMDRSEPASAAHTQIVYSDCWLRRRCHLVDAGRFYTCTRPAHFHSVLGDSVLDGSVLDDSASGAQRSTYLDDGVVMATSKDLVNDLHRYLVASHPLSSCAICLGGDAEEHDHRQLSVAETKVEFVHRRRVLQHANDAARS